MSLTKETKIDQITVVEDGTVLFREVITVKENDVQLSETYHRTSLAPDSDLTNIPNNVVVICNVVWTPEVIASYKSKLNF
jgi:hypothetical protein